MVYYRNFNPKMRIGYDCILPRICFFTVMISQKMTAPRSGEVEDSEQPRRLIYQKFPVIINQCRTQLFFAMNEKEIQ